MVNREELLAINTSYHAEHFLTEGDVEMANIYLAAIRNSRSRMGRPVVGDILIKDGKRAHIENVGVGSIEICESPYTPFTSVRFKGGYDAEISTNTSGGPWSSLPISTIKSSKTTAKKRFCFWWHCGMTGNGAVEIEADVNVFEIK